MHPPALTPERIDAMLSATAEIAMAHVEQAGVWSGAADNIADFERAGRALQTAARNLRQTIALKQRYDRDELGLAPERRREAEVARRQALRAREEAAEAHRFKVLQHFEQVLWREYEPCDWEPVYTCLNDRLEEIDSDFDFLATSVEDLVARFSDEFATAPGDPDWVPDPYDDGDEDDEDDPEPVARANVPAHPARPPPIAPP